MVNRISKGLLLPELELKLMYGLMIWLHNQCLTLFFFFPSLLQGFGRAHGAKVTEHTPLLHCSSYDTIPGRLP
jgi:hypothetical protein